MGAISTSEEGTTSLSKMDSPRFPTVCVRSSRRPAPAGEGEDAMSALLPGAAIPIHLASPQTSNIFGEAHGEAKP
uniref:Uncharacterized protein n=1 Tax=Arundo donax TaxID=35708 RepID=A0A0A9CQV6_ARUDO